MSEFYFECQISERVYFIHFYLCKTICVRMYFCVLILFYFMFVLLLGAAVRALIEP